MDYYPTYYLSFMCYQKLAWVVLFIKNYANLYNVKMNVYVREYKINIKITFYLRNDQDDK